MESCGHCSFPKAINQCDVVVFALLYIGLHECHQTIPTVSSVVAGGVVHSFTGEIEEAEALLELHPRMAIGINGCSVKTDDSLDAMAAVPLTRLLLETDAPWCASTTQPHATCTKLYALDG